MRDTVPEYFNIALLVMQHVLNFNYRFRSSLFRKKSQWHCQRNIYYSGTVPDYPIHFSWALISAVDIFWWTCFRNFRSYLGADITLRRRELLFFDCQLENCQPGLILHSDKAQVYSFLDSLFCPLPATVYLAGNGTKQTQGFWLQNTRL